MAGWKAPLIETRRATLRLSLVATLLVAFMPLRANAVTTPVLDAPLSNLVNGTTTYVAHASTTQNNERVNTAVFTLPANADLSGVSIGTVSVVEQPGAVPYPITGVSVDPVANTVTIDITFPKDKPTENFDVRVGGVVNPSQPGAYSYSVTLASTRPPAMTGTLGYTLSPGGSAVSVGAAVLSDPTPAAPVAVSLPVTLGARGRLSGTTAGGPNTVSVTFPAGYVLPASPPAGSVTIGGVAVDALSVAGNTVTFALPAGLTLPGGGATTVSFDAAFGLVNPAAGSYSISVSTSAEAGAGTCPPFAIGVPHLVVSIDVSSVDFGVIYPGTLTAPATVNVTVDCDASYVITRDVTGDVAAMGLTVTGDASGTKAGGTPTVHTDTFRANMSWDTDPGLPLSVDIQYTVVRS